MTLLYYLVPELIANLPQPGGEVDRLQQEARAQRIPGRRAQLVRYESMRFGCRGPHNQAQGVPDLIFQEPRSWAAHVGVLLQPIGKPVHEPEGMSRRPSAPPCMELIFRVPATQGAYAIDVSGGIR